MRAALAFMGLFCLAAQAAPFAVPVGQARIGLDAPPGFADTGFTGSPRLQQLAESQTSPSNRILMFAISDGDLRRFMSGDTPEFRRYMMAVTPKALERERIDVDEFKRLVAAASREPEATQRLAELRADREVFSVLRRTALPSPPSGLFDEEKPQQYVLSTLTVILLRGKALNLSVYTLHQTPEDLEWIRGTTARWIDELQHLNSR